jgi:Ser/Thr protein kinase RdoA (MazF antagonist)
MHWNAKALRFSVPHYNGGRVGLIDFDDCGWGYYIYDLATTISRLNREAPSENGRQRLQQAFLSGYETVRPFPNGFQESLPWFLAFRELVITTFILGSHNQRVHEWGSRRVKRAVETLSELLEAI